MERSKARKKKRKGGCCAVPGCRRPRARGLLCQDCHDFVLKPTGDATSILSVNASTALRKEVEDEVLSKVCHLVRQLFDLNYVRRSLDFGSLADRELEALVRGR